MKAIASILLSGVCVLSLGGVVFGFSSLYPVLYRELVFVDSCGSTTKDQCSGQTTKCCDNQVFLASEHFPPSCGVRFRSPLHERLGALQRPTSRYHIGGYNSVMPISTWRRCSITRCSPPRPSLLRIAAWSFVRAGQTTLLTTAAQSLMRLVYFLENSS